MRILSTTVLALAVAALTLAGCGGKSKSQPRSPDATEDHGMGGHTYAGAKQSADPCADSDLKTDPCSGDE